MVYGLGIGTALVAVVVVPVVEGCSGDDGLVVVVVALGSGRPLVADHVVLVVGVVVVVVAVTLEGRHVQRNVNVPRHCCCCCDRKGIYRFDLALLGIIINLSSNETETVLGMYVLRQ